MTDEKPRKPRAGKSGAGNKPGGDKPMRRRSAGGEEKRDVKPRARTFDRGDGDDKRPRFETPEKPAARPKPRRIERAELKPPEKTSAFEGERIAKAMARAGVCSRRDAEIWIAEGRVAVNGRVMTSPAVNVTESDRVEIDGAPMQARERTRLFLFHKPAGLVTTARDEEGRPTVFDFLSQRHSGLPRLVSVGRLDINTEGLLLLTNDGGLARTLELPATGWTRRYRVRAHGDTDQARLDALREGVAIEDVTYAPIEARLEREQGSNVWIAMALTEGKNREVKRVMAHLGLEVTRLIRVSYGPFQLGELAEGAVEEVRLKTLREQLGKNLAQFAGVDFGAPLRETTPAGEQEKRERLDRRSRKHVSVLREQREEERAHGPRARVTTAATADRKGRAVAVERVTLVRPRRDREDAAETRNARRFAALRSPARRPSPDEGETRPGPKRARGESRAGRSAADPGAVPGKRERVAKGRRERTTEAAAHRFHGEARAAREQTRAPADRDESPRPDKRRSRRAAASPERAAREKFETREGASNSRANRRAGSREESVGPTRRREAEARPSRKGPPKGPRKGPPKSAPRKGGPGAGPPRKGLSEGGPHKSGPRKSGPRKGGPGKGGSNKGPHKPRSE